MASSILRNTYREGLDSSTARAMGEDYQWIITSYVEKVYIPMVQLTEKKPKSICYLPHFPVSHPERLTSKTRIIFDATAKFHGTCSNGHILPSPKLQTNLFDRFLRLHRFPVAVAWDVSEIYLSICMPPKDRPKFRSLWRNSETDHDPDVY